MIRLSNNVKGFLGLLFALFIAGFFAGLIVFTAVVFSLVVTCENGRVIDHTKPEYCREILR